MIGCISKETFQYPTDRKRSDSGSSLNIVKAAGFDGSPAELFKYCGVEFAKGKSLVSLQNVVGRRHV